MPWEYGAGSYSVTIMLSNLILRCTGVQKYFLPDKENTGILNVPLKRIFFNFFILKMAITTLLHKLFGKGVGIELRLTTVTSSSSWIFHLQFVIHFS